MRTSSTLFRLGIAQRLAIALVLAALIWAMIYLVVS
jgi:hypothetical protein